MKRPIFILILILTSYNLYSQTSYTGVIDKYPIELVTDIYSDGVVSAIYTYSNYDEPIVVNGELRENKLTLFEKDKGGKNKAKLVFDNFDSRSTEQQGLWTDLTSAKQLEIKLKKTFDLEPGGDHEWVNKELLQPVSIKDKYFKLVLSKGKEDFSASVTAVKILEKKTDKLIQQIDLNCQLSGLNNISVQDYNFDGLEDFSVFESSYAGPNTSSLYFLFNPKTNRYFDSGYSGTSLEFDGKAKRIYERNQCCAGAAVTTAEYKVVNNKMVLIKQHCFKWDEAKQDLVERKMEECQ